ncbi:hypothetical protein AArcMg_0740 [Natrarchaeobaculum sulfurireducens]|uniref:Uncharacterized protein n=1 Tax=Natrarchaeobaculum sulfurireducens TaxID=2044521 RepID=A0A346PML7_9EURY|nr:hypothetical protein AArcMg_0740 [Natrarchaeobaculum sulfurireducens]
MALGWRLESVIDALFVLAVGLFAIATVLTRPSVSRRRARRETTGASERGVASGRSSVRDPSVQFRTGIRLVLVAVALFTASFLFQHGAL